MERKVGVQVQKMRDLGFCKLRNDELAGRPSFLMAGNSHLPVLRREYTGSVECMKWIGHHLGGLNVEKKQ